MRDAVRGLEVGRETAEVLRRLRDRDGEFVSGTDLSRELGISRTGVWNSVRYLTSLGYEIEARTKRGYRLAARRWRLSPPEILDAVPSRFGEVHYYTVVSSTIEVARRLAREGGGHGSLVLAEYQSKGRGRTGRKWYAPLGTSILASVVWRPAQEADLGGLPLLLANAAAEASGGDLMWPNDVFVDGRKVGGVLVTTVAKGDDVTAVLSMGLNVLGDPESFPEGVADRVTTLEAAGLAEGPEDRTRILASWLGLLGDSLTGLDDGLDPYEEWAGRLAGAGETAVWLDDAGTRREGEFVSGAPGGAAKVRLNGTEETLSAERVALFRLTPPN